MDIEIKGKYDCAHIFPKLATSRINIIMHKKGIKE